MALTYVGLLAVLQLLEVITWMLTDSIVVFEISVALFLLL